MPEANASETSVAAANIRRSLIFPYLRLWDLGTLAARDVGEIFSAGRRCILRCLLQVRADPKVWGLSEEGKLALVYVFFNTNYVSLDRIINPFGA